MHSKRKLIISLLVVSFVLLSVIATVVIAFALAQQTIKTTLNITYTSEDIDGTASASYTIGGVTESLTAMKGTNVIGDTLVFRASDTEDAGNLMFPAGALELGGQNDNVVIEYTYSNTGSKHYIATMSFDANIVAENMKVEYSINGTDYSEDRYAVVVPANTTNRSYWIKISVVNKANSASFTGDFNWLLSACDPQNESYLSLTSLEFTGSNGAYSASVSTSGNYLSEIIFPSEVNKDPVTIIATSTLTPEQKAQVTRVQIPASVKTIKDNAFDGFTNLQTVTFEENSQLVSIGNQSFNHCKNLRSITIPDNVTSIGDGAFWDCSRLRSITIPDSVTTIGQAAFMDCSALTSVTIGGGVTYIGYYAFENCSALTSVTIGSAGVGEGAFRNCTALTSVTLGNGVYGLGQNAFAGCTRLRSITIPDSVTDMGNGTFSGCIGLTSVTIGGGVTVIGANVFENCSGLSNIEIPDSVEIIAPQAFKNCTGLSSVIIGSNVAEIYYQAFENCSGLTSVTFKNKIGWSADGTPISDTELTDPSNAATLLKDTYLEVQWSRT